jgi:hypothetical protein
MARSKRTKKPPGRAPRASGGLPLFSGARSEGSSFIDAYLTQSREPLTVLCFLLPVLVLYEVLLLVALRATGGLITPDAHRWILTLFEAFELGTVGLWLPGVLVVLVLLAWHIIERRPARCDGSVVGLMWSESIVLALPLLVLSQAVLRIPAEATSAGGVEFASLPLSARIAVSVGAGIYEELLFRLGLIGLLLVVFEDVLKTPRRTAVVVAVALSAIAFMAYHPLRDDSGAVVMARVVFYLGAGVYFGVLYVVRGFGIAVGAHAVYDILAAMLASNAGDAAGVLP